VAGKWLVLQSQANGLVPLVLGEWPNTAKAGGKYGVGLVVK